MEPHPIPRQITTFEFRLIWFLTLKQFIYLVIFIPFGVVVFYLFPIPIFNILLAIIVAGLGFALAFLPINDRPLEVWIRNLFKRLVSPTQYLYQKQNPPLYFLKDLVFESDPHRVLTHIRSQELLNQYLKKSSSHPLSSNQKKQAINNLFRTPIPPPKKKSPSPTPSSTEKPQAAIGGRIPFLSGIVKNHKLIPLPGILIYVKNEKGEIVRLLKTNPHGVFATFNPLSAGEYFFELKDPKNIYLFDTIKIKVEAKNLKPLEFYSKELI